MLIVGIFFGAALVAVFSFSDASAAPRDPFKQLDDVWPTPDAQRRASGAPGPGYWQQQADYVIDVELDETNNRILGSETITYHNNSKDTLDYLWMQLDQNLFDPKMMAHQSRATSGLNDQSFNQFDGLLNAQEFDGGYNITAVKDAAGKPLKNVIVQTMMRIIPPQPLKPGGKFSF